jgi:hypothetical protein
MEGDRKSPSAAASAAEEAAAVASGVLQWGKRLSGVRHCSSRRENGKMARGGAPRRRRSRGGRNGLNNGDDVAPKVPNPGQMAMGASEEPSSPSNRARSWHEATHQRCVASAAVKQRWGCGVSSA